MTLKRQAPGILFVLSLLAPVLLSFAVLPLWYELRTDREFVLFSEGGFESGYGQAALGCALGCVVLSLPLRRYLVLTSILLSLGALGAIVLAREDYPDPRFGGTTTAFNVALAVAAFWSAQSLLTLMLWPRARASVPRTLSTIAGTPRGIKNARVWRPETVESSLRSAVVERWALGIGLACAAAAIVGAFGPWIKASSGLVSLSVSGTDGSNDGWLVVAAAGIGAAALVGASVKDSIRLMLVAFLAGIASAGVAWYDRHNAQEAIGDSELFAQIGWGLNLALVASIGLAISALVLVRSARGAFRTPDTASGHASPLQEHRGASPEQPYPASELERLAELHMRGVLTDEEFTQAKARVLGTPPEERGAPANRR